MFLPWLLEIADPSSHSATLKSMTSFENVGSSSSKIVLPSASKPENEDDDVDVVDDKKRKKGKKSDEPSILAVIETKKVNKKRKYSPKSPPKRDSTPIEQFKSAIAEVTFEPERNLLWHQLNRISSETQRNIAKKLLIYLLINKHDQLTFSPRGTLILRGHELPKSDIAESFSNLLSATSGLPDVGELIILSLLDGAPSGLWAHIPKMKKKWLLLDLAQRRKCRTIVPQDVVGEYPGPSENEIAQLTPNPNDGVVIKPSLKPKFSKESLIVSTNAARKPRKKSREDLTKKFQVL